ncbi:glycosyltransferase family 59 protein [Metarhizium album ARSEF 1941]|uniref:Dol-P-Glc:Glc(2)Man(9)GlcNAc(2)-PP-Dol alpha-1,2-glucosyltransferase n=1 Tax=Metarhizium album (strain ARSEF 1941) TaxID=1081103 RepID=A0A0B2X1L9_METAS|nr:glycosyltransferase family 59 protein [Metarhizium album ARSEF 1941]KHN98985.1 glycosyltransferase family 59 protein [Metarhizium album ARSEF 1941]
MAEDIEATRHWVPPLATLTLFIPPLLLFAPETRHRGRFFLLFCLLALLSGAWFAIVSETVSEPYLDEVFHIPQAQKYCEGKFLDWDDKITTPPGLYLFSIVLQRIFAAVGIPGMFSCDASSLRVTNVLGLIILASLTLLCRHEIESRLCEARSSTSLETISPYAVHTAFNIALFPLLFFFSGLYYTDVISTAVVVGGYLNHLKRVGRDRSSCVSDLTTIFLGLLALSMRQTNVFWTVVWMGGLEAVHAIKTLRPQGVEQPLVTTLTEQAKFYAWRYSIGDVHDPPLNLARPDDLLFTAISLGIAALCNPFRVTRQIWPYVSILAAFAGFVVWNGSVVLGDKSNHVATIHLAQLLYVWPFFAFFSVPLFLPQAISLLRIARNVLHSPSQNSQRARSGRPSKMSKLLGSSNSVKSKELGKAKATDARDTVSPAVADSPSLGSPSPPLKRANFIFNSKFIPWIIYILFTFAAPAAIVKFNTIIHPFTLADNRHYMFYIFRYTIRRGRLIRFMLILPYTISRWMVWGTLTGCPDSILSSNRELCSARYNMNEPAPYTNSPRWIARGTKKTQKCAEHPQDMSQVSSSSISTDDELKSALKNDPILVSAEPTSTSTGLIFLLTTALSLMTAPLVEPRYFILPWVMWRLLVPAWRIHDHAHANSLFERVTPPSIVRKTGAILRRFDLRLVVETLWFVAINVATGYLFLMKPYIWRDEQGKILHDGRLQRFMW